MNDPGWRTRGLDDLPHLLRMWVSEDPEWRIVKVERAAGNGPYMLRLIHVKVDADFDYAETEWLGWDPEDVRHAVLDVLNFWYLKHGVYNRAPYDERKGAVKISITRP